jgi:glycosyltransferase involved in cell wall biosynthesis
MKSVLAIRTHAYPDGATATRRFESFCRYLHEAGVDVTLLALEPTDPDMAGRRHLHPDCRFEVIQISEPVRRSQLWKRIENRLSRTWMPGWQCRSDGTRMIEAAADRLLRQRRFDCLLTTFPPMSSLFVADRLSRRHRLPWIADLRDIPDEIDVERKQWATRRSVRHLSSVCASASHVLTVSDPLAARLRSDYGLKVPVATVYNGFEESDAPTGEGGGDSWKFGITYCGSLGYGRDMSLVLHALDMLLDRGTDLKGVEINLYGESGVPGLKAGRWRSSDRIRCHGRVDHAASLRAQRDSAILLSLSSPNVRGILTSKIFECAMMGRPVLSVPADGDVLDQFVRESRIGLASSDVPGIAAFIEGHLRSWRETGQRPVSSPDYRYLSGFSRRNQAGKLVELLEQMT